MTVTNYIWDAERDSYLMETDDADVTTAVYTNEPQQFGRLISQRRGNETSYYHEDGVGSARELTESTETISDTYIYDAWGEDIARTGATANSFQWIGAVGYYRDLETRTYYVRARVYQPAIGRWLSVDPLGVSPQNSTLYTCADNSPLNNFDPSGLLTTTPTGHYCPGCGSACMKWSVKSKGLLEEGLVVQKICFTVNIVTCERRQGCCKGTKRHFCKVCYYEEVFRFTDRQEGIDTWSFPRILRTDCGQRGTATISAQIRAYRSRQEGYPKSNWTNGSGTVKCGEFSIGASDFTMKEPSWWNAHVDEVASDMRAEWRCCEGDDQKSSLGCGSEGSDELSSCGDSVDPRWEGDCFG